MTWSCSPTDTPPETSRTSALERRGATRACGRARRRRVPRLHRRAPAPRTGRASDRAVGVVDLARVQRCPAATSSEPVTRIATRGRRWTSTSPTPAAAPRSARAASARAPAGTALARADVLAAAAHERPGGTAARSQHAVVGPSPSSRRRIASAPGGSGAPVEIAQRRAGLERRLARRRPPRPSPATGSSPGEVLRAHRPAVHRRAVEAGQVERARRRPARARGRRRRRARRARPAAAARRAATSAQASLDLEHRSAADLRTSCAPAGRSPGSLTRCLSSLRQTASRMISLEVVVGRARRAAAPRRSVSLRLNRQVRSLPVGGEADAVAVAAERLGDRVDEADPPVAVGEAVDARGGAAARAARARAGRRRRSPRGSPRR